jgi:hypothetical protein
MDEQVKVTYSKKKDFRLVFFRTDENTYFYRQENYMYDRFTSVIDWVPYSIRPTSSQFDSLELAEHDAYESIAWLSHTDDDSPREPHTIKVSLFGGLINYVRGGQSNHCI